jgi:hypothetical protein
MYFELTWYGLIVAEVQAPGANKVWHDVRPNEARKYADGETYARLTYLDERGYDLPNWTIDWMDTYEWENRGEL